MTLAARRQADADATRLRALPQGLARFPVGGGGPTTADRYVWPDTFTLEEWRQVRLAPVYNTKQKG